MLFRSRVTAIFGGVVGRARALDADFADIDVVSRPHLLSLIFIPGSSFIAALLLSSTMLLAKHLTRRSFSAVSYYRGAATAATAGGVVWRRGAASAVALSSGVLFCVVAAQPASTSYSEAAAASDVLSRIRGLFESAKEEHKEEKDGSDEGPGKRVVVPLEPEVVESLPILDLDEVRKGNGSSSESDRLLVTYDGKHTRTCPDSLEACVSLTPISLSLSLSLL
jgi:hypothetical protein